MTICDHITFKLRYVLPLNLLSPCRLPFVEEGTHLCKGFGEGVDLRSPDCIPGAADRNTTELCNPEYLLLAPRP